MAEIIARTSSKDYPIYLSAGLLDRMGSKLAAMLGGRRVMVVTDSTVAPLYLSRVLKSLYAAGLKTASYEVAAGEREKNLTTLNSIYHALYMSDITRADALIALGGGVIGDMVGLAAATYQRGIKLIQVPTTLMAQVDSAIGGKTAIDMPFGKNMIGAFYQPHAVCIDPQALQTLPRAELNNGLAEVIKYGCIKDRDLFERLEKRSIDLEWVVQRCVEIKLRVIKNDERDTGERMQLNFGHSIGHAIEKVTQYELFRHGEAVSIGMVAAARLGEKLAVTPAGTAERISKVLQAYQLPVTTSDVDWQEVFHALKADKKKIGDKLNFILLSAIGEALAYPLTLEELGPLLEGLLD